MLLLLSGGGDSVLGCASSCLSTTVGGSGEGLFMSTGLVPFVGVGSVSGVVPGKEAGVGVVDTLPPFRAARG